MVVVAERGAYKPSKKYLKILPCFNRWGNYEKEILEALTEIDPDIVHIQHEFALFHPDDRFLKLLDYLENTRIVVTMHTVHTNITSDWGGMAMSMEEYIRAIGRRVDKIIVHQNSMRDALISEGVKERKIHVIQHGTPILEKLDQKKARAGLRLPKEGKTILSFGFFGRNKNRGVIIEALPRILKAIPDAYLFISCFPREWVREDSECLRDYKEKADKMKLKDHVIFSDRFIPDEEIPAALSSSDIAILPYNQRYLSASGSLHLALGAYKPVVVSRIPKFEEMWEEISDEMVFNPTDSQRLAEIVVKALKDERFRKRIVSKVKLYADKTSWKETAKKHVDLYRSLLVP